VFADEIFAIGLRQELLGRLPARRATSADRRIEEHEEICTALRVGSDRVRLPGTTGHGTTRMVLTGRAISGAAVRLVRQQPQRATNLRPSTQR